MIQAIIADGSSIITIMIISHYMGLREMICYSNVWFVMYMVYIVNEPWYDTVYKHVNVASAVGTKDGYRLGGLYIKIGVIGDFLVALPLSVAAVAYMPTIFRWIGYDEATAEMSQSYAAIVALNSMFDSTTGLLDCILDIEGHAGFTAAFEFWETLIHFPIEYLFIRWYEPSLWELGIFHFTADLVSTAIYFIMTGYFKRWFASYREGLKAPIRSAVSHRQAHYLLAMNDQIYTYQNI